MHSEKKEAKTPNIEVWKFLTTYIVLLVGVSDAKACLGGPKATAVTSSCTTKQFVALEHRKSHKRAVQSSDPLKRLLVEES